MSFKLPSFEKVFGFKMKLSGEIEIISNQQYDSDNSISIEELHENNNNNNENDNNNKYQPYIHGRWTKEEHNKFLELLTKYGTDWEKIASEIPTRTKVQVKSHADKCLYLSFRENNINK